MSTNIVRRELHEEGLRSSKKQKIPLLMGKNVRCRLQDWPIHECYVVIFSDESKINRFKSDVHARCRVTNGRSQLQAHHMGQIVKHGGGAIFVWGCMTSLGMGYTC